MAKKIRLNVDLIYPIGSIYFSVKNVNPSTYFGGTWTAWGQGRVPVGVDTSQTEFKTVEKTGGNKSHNHLTPIGSKNDGTFDFDMSMARSSHSDTSDGWGANTSLSSVGASKSLSRAYTSENSTLQPYITCYMWKRTA